MQREEKKKESSGKELRMENQSSPITDMFDPLTSFLSFSEAYHQSYEEVDPINLSLGLESGLLHTMPVVDSQLPDSSDLQNWEKKSYAIENQELLALLELKTNEASDDIRFDPLGFSALPSESESDSEKLINLSYPERDAAELQNLEPSFINTARTEVGEISPSLVEALDDHISVSNPNKLPGNMKELSILSPEKELLRRASSIRIEGDYAAADDDRFDPAEFLGNEPPSSITFNNRIDEVGDTFCFQNSIDTLNSNMSFNSASVPEEWLSSSNPIDIFKNLLEELRNESNLLNELSNHQATVCSSHAKNSSTISLLSIQQGAKKDHSTNTILTQTQLMKKVSQEDASERKRIENRLSLALHRSEKSSQIAQSLSPAFFQMPEKSKDSKGTAKKLKTKKLKFLSSEGLGEVVIRKR